MKILDQGCRVISPNDGEWIAEGTRRFRTPINRANGSRDIAQTISQYERGLAPVRCNPASEEVLYVFAGAGRCWVDDQIYEVRTGSAIFIPPSTNDFASLKDVAGRTSVPSACGMSRSTSSNPIPSSDSKAAL